MTILQEQERDELATAINWFLGEGFEVTLPHKTTNSYDFIVTSSQKAVVKIKNLEKPVNQAQALNFSRFLDSPEGAEYDKGYLLSKNGFSANVYKNLGEKNYSTNLVLGIFFDGSEKKTEYPDVMHSIETYEEQETIFEELSLAPKAKTKIKLKIAVCTFKGGVGKTTCSAHLAGAFAWLNNEVSLIDADPEKHLLKLLIQAPSENVKSKKIALEDSGKSFTLYSLDKWLEHERDSSITIYDCAPTKEATYKHIFETIDFCLIPINLTPLGIGSDIHVVNDTKNHISKINPKVKCLILINNRPHKEHKVAKVLRDKLKQEVKKAQLNLIEPDIRHSEQLLYWGADGKLAFNRIAGKCYPKEDFVNLAEYLIRLKHLENSRQSRNLLRVKFKLQAKLHPAYLPTQ
jgi:chromosome partitioning protein